MKKDRVEYQDERLEQYNRYDLDCLEFNNKKAYYHNLGIILESPKEDADFLKALASEPNNHPLFQKAAMDRLVQIEMMDREHGKENDENLNIFLQGIYRNPEQSDEVREAAYSDHLWVKGAPRTTEERMQDFTLTKKPGIHLARLLFLED